MQIENLYTIDKEKKCITCIYRSDATTRAILHNALEKIGGNVYVEIDPFGMRRRLLAYKLGSQKPEILIYSEDDQDEGSRFQRNRAREVKYGAFERYYVRHVNKLE